MKITAGVLARASSKQDTTSFSLLPTSPLTMSVARRLMNAPPIGDSDSRANAVALASRVLPVPGGPKSNTPVGGERPNADSTRRFLGSSANASSNATFASVLPPTEANISPSLDNDCVGGDPPPPVLLDKNVTPIDVSFGASLDTIFIASRISKAVASRALPVPLSTRYELRCLATLRNSPPLALVVDAAITGNSAKASTDNLIRASSNALRKARYRVFAEG
mmetsp:Transcript_28596/g.58108  ORF Transcript_28596/g.58108 Transcript_28596/m.58108 type:complete len:222 (-) Transcript_28596:113-778(-)